MLGTTMPANFVIVPSKSCTLTVTRSSSWVFLLVEPKFESLIRYLPVASTSIFFATLSCINDRDAPVSNNSLAVHDCGPSSL